MRLSNSRLPKLVAATAVLLTTAATIPALGATAKLGGTCTKSQVGKTSGTLVCSKSGTKYKWTKRVTSTPAATRPPSTQTPVASSTAIDVAAIVFGAAPATASSKLDIACIGLAGATSQGIGSVSFGARGGTNRVPFALLSPSSSNPSGSTCTATATASGAKSVQFLINGLPDGTTGTGPNATSRSFIGADSVVTLLIEYPGTSPAVATPVTSTIPGASAITTTTTPGSGASTTTTIGGITPPPASGRPELVSRFLSTVPATMTGIDLTVNCTPPAAGGSFQTQSVRLGTVPATAQLGLTLSAGAATTAPTACQVEARLLGTDVGGANLRYLLNGQPLSGATTGSFINSPTFSAPQAFTVVLEVTFPSLLAVTTTTLTGAGTTTTTALGATTSTLPANQAVVSLALTRTGTAPANLDGYFVDLACSNVLVGSNPNGSFSFRSKILPAGGVTSVPVTINAGSQCSVTVTSIPTTGSISTGTVSIATGGVPRAAGPGGAATTPPFAITTGVQTVTISVSY